MSGTTELAKALASPTATVAPAASVVGYADDAPPAIEPTALFALAHLANGDIESACRAARWLVASQAYRGSLGVFADQGEPCWTTGWAILVWRRLDARLGTGEFAKAAKRAEDWLLESQGTIQPNSPDLGHDATLLGWSWVEGTHSWIEPTAIATLTLKHAGYRSHARIREALRLLVNRQLPGGGWNYGNTTVLRQFTLPHIQPSALALLALQGEECQDAIAKGIAYLRRAWSEIVGASSLAYAAMALKAHGASMPDAKTRLESLLRENRLLVPSPARHALLTLALTGDANPLIWSVTAASSEPARG